MSISSDDTDVLVLLPPDLFVVPDELEVEHRRDGVSSVASPVEQLNETVNGTGSMRRYGSADTLTPSSRNSLRSRSLQTTPLKYTTHPKNILTEERYVSQRERDEKCLREITEYFKSKRGGGDAESLPPALSLDVPKVHELIAQMEETERDMGVKSNQNEVRNHSGKSEDAYKIIDSTRRSLNFDSPLKNNGIIATKSDQTNQTDYYKNQLTIKTDESLTQRDHLLSLHNLWPSNSHSHKTTTYEELQVLRQRLEEERLRRQHCENMIQNLQKRLLESQEKVAVAFQVDEEKNIAINKLRESWSRVVEQWKDVEAQKNEMTKKLTEEREKFQDERDVLTSNAKRYEDELLKALNLVHEYKEDHRLAVRDRDLMAAELASAQEQLRALEESHSELQRELREKISLIEQSTGKVEELTQASKELKKQLKHLQIEKERLSLEKEAKCVLQKKLDEALKREGNFQEQLRSATKVKTDLKQYYQDQVENIVMEKQKDFQTQLSKAEKSLQKLFEAKEQSIIDASNREKQQLLEKHKLEVVVLEEKQREEVGLYELQIVQRNGKIESLQAMVARLKKHIDELPEKLHSITQHHWKETLKLVPCSVPSDNNYVDDCSGDIPLLKRQNTFTKDEEEERNCGPTLRRMGSLTYRINETPQKLNTKAAKECLEEAEQMGVHFVTLEDSLSSVRSGLNNMNDTLSSKDKGKSRSDKSPWK